MHSIVKKAFIDGWTAHKLAQSAAIGFYIAFSPFPAGHTVMMLFFKYVFKLNFPVLFLTTSINNPCTAIPFFSFDYAFGYWLIHTFLGIEPNFQISLARIFGSGSICLWSFLIGGNLLGILAGVLSYPIFLLVFGKIAPHNFSPS